MGHMLSYGKEIHTAGSTRFSESFHTLLEMFPQVSLDNVTSIQSTTGEHASGNLGHIADTSSN